MSRSVSAPDADPSFGVAGTDAAAWPRAEALAQRLSLPLFDARESDWRLLPCTGVLLVSAAGLALAVQDCGATLTLALTGRGGPSPVAVDFSSATLLHRLRGIGPRREDLARAVGLPAPRRLQVVDATAGWGRDSAVLAALGCEVTMIERHPVVAALLEDGLCRAGASAAPEVLQFLPRLRLLAGDAAVLLAAAALEAPDVVLIDPMFPGRAKSAAVRKEMVLFQQLVGGDVDAAGLLEVALAVARHRVVVKRPVGAPPLEGRQPDFSLQGRSTRFDVHALRRIA